MQSRSANEGRRSSPRVTPLGLELVAVWGVGGGSAHADEVHGFSEDAWIPYLNEDAIDKVGSSCKKTGRLLPIIAKDGPHYANSVEAAGPGEDHVVYGFQPTSVAGFLRHLDKATGVREWGRPSQGAGTSRYPSTAKEG